MCVTKPGKTDVRILTEGHPKGVVKLEILDLQLTHDESMSNL